MLSLLGLVGAVACGDSTGVEGPQNVTVNFRVTDGSAPMATGPAVGPALVGGPLEIAGSNGTVSLDEIHIIINEVELKPADGSCDAVEISSSSDDCPEFEAPPRFLDLPLDGTPVDAVTAAIPTGTYKELDFEIEDLEDDEDEPGMAAQIEMVRSQILTQFSNWPRKASALIVGSFQPVGGTAEAFEVYIDAEIEIEFELVPNLVIADDGAASRSLTVDVRPEIWFLNPDGSVLDLRAWDYDSTQRLLEIEVEMEESFTEIEIDG